MHEENDEVYKILKLLEDRKINAMEAARLLEAIRDKKPSRKFLKVRAYEEGKDAPRIKVDVPWSVVKAFVRFGGSLHGLIPKDFKVNVKDKEVNLSDLEVDALEQLVHEMAAGERFNIAEVWDDVKKERVEVYIE